MNTVSAPFFESLVALVAYPRRDVTPIVQQCVATLPPWLADAAVPLERFAYAVATMPLHVVENEYVRAFDFDPDCALELGWHLFGETVERGGFLADVREDLERAGIKEAEGLPDHLANLLPLLAREDPIKAAELACRIAPAVSQVRAALAERHSPYTHLIAAVEAAVSGVRDGRIPEATTP
jgi:nitrate reductase molybdenum cofactor assembly chaperone